MNCSRLTLWSLPLFASPALAHHEHTSASSFDAATWGLGFLMLAVLFSVIAVYLERFMPMVRKYAPLRAKAAPATRLQRSVGGAS